MKEILIKLHNASLQSFGVEPVKNTEKLIYKQTVNEGYNHFSAIRFSAEYINFSVKYSVNEFNSEINEIEVNNDVYFILDTVSHTCSILYKIDRVYIDSLDIMLNQESIYSISSNELQLTLDQLLLPESDFFLIDIDNELYVYDSAPNQIILNF